MMEVCAVEESLAMQFNAPYDNIDLYVSYVRKIEQEFQATVGDLLEQYGMSHLIVK
jgi:hypothetical protein